MGPLTGYKILEFAGIGPTQLCGMLLADMGAEIIRLDRLATSSPEIGIEPRFDLMNRSRKTIAVNLKSERGRALALRLCEDADAAFEGFRPGVMENLGLGPDDCMARNPALVYGRMTGWGQEGCWAGASGHDHNYLALTGALACIGERGGPPVYPTNLVADFGGGATYLVMGLLAALLEASRSGKGQVVDAAMVDGVTSLMTLIHGLRAAGQWQEKRGSNLLDGGAPFARPYRTSDGRYITIAPLESRFFAELLKRLEVNDLDPSRQYDPAYWPVIEARLAAVIGGRTRDEWDELLGGSDACYAPVLELSEVASHPHMEERQTFVSVDGISQPAPAPRFSRTPSDISSAAQGQVSPGEVLRTWGLDEAEIRLFVDET